MAYAPKILSGVDVVDEAWGGLYRGGSYLLYGRAATGRGLLTLMFAQTGVMLEERCLFISPDRPKDLMIQAASMGFNLRDAHESGLVKMMRIPPMLNLQEIGDDGIAKALNDLVSIVRQNRPDRLVINDFMPFVQFRSFDRFRAAFVQMLEQVDSLDTTMELVLAEPANEQSRKVVEFMRSQMTGAIHIELVGEDAHSTKRRLTLIPNIGHIKRRVVEFWDLQKVVEEFDDNASSSLRMLPVTRGEQPQDQSPFDEPVRRRRFRFGDGTAAPSSGTPYDQAPPGSAAYPADYEAEAGDQPVVRPRRLGETTQPSPYDSAPGAYAPAQAPRERTPSVQPIPLGRHAARPSESAGGFLEPLHNVAPAPGSALHDAPTAPRSQTHRTERPFVGQSYGAQERREAEFRGTPAYRDRRERTEHGDRESAFGYADEHMHRDETGPRVAPDFRGRAPAHGGWEPEHRRGEPMHPREEPTFSREEPFGREEPKWSEKTFGRAEPKFGREEPINEHDELPGRQEEPTDRRETAGVRHEEENARREEPSIRHDEDTHRYEEPAIQPQSAEHSTDRSGAGYRVEPVYQDEPYTAATPRRRGEPSRDIEPADREEARRGPEPAHRQERNTADAPKARGSSSWTARSNQFRTPDQPAEPRSGEPLLRPATPGRIPSPPPRKEPAGESPARDSSAATPPSRGRASHTDRDAFRTRLQQHFLRRDVNETPFLLVAMRMDRSEERTARPFDFDFILDLVSELLREQDDMLVELDRERLIVLLANSRPEEAQHFFARLKNRLRDEAPQQADHLLHSVSAIVVPDGRPFQNAEEFLTYALDEA